MRILIVSTLKRNVTQDQTASRSQMIYRLGFELAKKGHYVSLLGTADSKIPGVTTIPVIEKGWVDMAQGENPFFFEVATLVQLAKKTSAIQKDFDIIHNHTYPEFFTPIISSELSIPLVTTIHSQGTPFFDEASSLFPNSYFIAISQAHKRMFQKTTIFDVVYNGIDTDVFSFSKEEGDYLLWIGRLSKAKDMNGNFLDPKGVSAAIEVAQKTGEKLLLAGSVEDPAFFDQKVKPFLNEQIQWVGPVASEQSLSKQEIVKLMQNAKAFLMTINWEEPFGLVMIEAMSCGTPVIAFNRGSVEEVVVDGSTGYIVDSENKQSSNNLVKETGILGLCRAVELISNIDRVKCREHVEKNFLTDTMVENYEKVYEKILAVKK